VFDGHLRVQSPYDIEFNHNFWWGSIEIHPRTSDDLAVIPYFSQG
jgi:hypothetical protein